MTDLETTVVTQPETVDAPSPLDEVLGKIDELNVLAAYLKRVVKPMLKKTTKGKRSRTVDPEKKTKNGFQAPVKLDPKLVNFMKIGFPNREVVDVVPRTEITQLMTTYIKSQDLQIPENRKNFRCDKALSDIFGVDVGYVTNWFEMQKLMKPLMTNIKPEPEPEAAPPETQEDTPVEDSTDPPAKPAKRIKKGTA